jgi:hypothetical protein
VEVRTNNQEEIQDDGGREGHGIYCSRYVFAFLSFTLSSAISVLASIIQ